MTCPNCRSQDVKGQWSDSHMAWRCILRLSPCYEGSHTHWRCRRCGYTWMTA